MKGCIFPFNKNGALRISKNYIGITLIAISAKIDNVLLLNRIKPEIDKFFEKIGTTFEEITPQPHRS